VHHLQFRGSKERRFHCQRGSDIRSDRPSLKLSLSLTGPADDSVCCPLEREDGMYVHRHMCPVLPQEPCLSTR
jgi:hypothetical protein